MTIEYDYRRETLVEFDGEDCRVLVAASGTAPNSPNTLGVVIPMVAITGRDADRIVARLEREVPQTDGALRFLLAELIDDVGGRAGELIHRAVG